MTNKGYTYEERIKLENEFEARQQAMDTKFAFGMGLRGLAKSPDARDALGAAAIWGAQYQMGLGKEAWKIPTKKFTDLKETNIENTVKVKTVGLPEFNKKKYAYTCPKGCGFETNVLKEIMEHEKSCRKGGA